MTTPFGPAPRRTQNNEAPIAAWQPLRRGTTSHASRRWRKGGPFTALDGVPRAAHRNDADRSCPRTASAPLEAHAAALGVLERGDGVQVSADVHRGGPRRGALYGAVLRGISPDVLRENRPRLAPNRLQNQKETTQRHDSRKRVASTA